MPASHRLARATLAGLALAAAGIALADPAEPPSAPRRFSSDSPHVLERRAEPSGRRTLEVVSQTLSFAGLKPSMNGPVAPHPGLALLESDAPELLWVTGIRLESVQSDADAPASPEFFCHANLELEPVTRSVPPAIEWPLFTLVPGRQEARLPEGFGLPVLSSRRLELTTMALNLNVADRPLRVRFKTRIEFVRDADLQAPLRPLARRYLFVLVPLRESGVEKVAGCAADPSGGCAGLPRVGATASPGGIVPRLFGDDVTLHWVVPPGRHEYRTLVTGQLALREDAVLHYASGHLHPFGLALELRDRADGRVLVSLGARGYPDRLGVAHMEDRSFPAGLALPAGRDYELVAVYDNPTDQPVDAMAIFYAYTLDREWRAPEPGRPR